MEAREFSSSGSCMPCSGNEDASLKHLGVGRREMIVKVEDVSSSGVLMEAAAAAAIEADSVATGGEEGSGLNPGPEELKGPEGSSGRKKRGRPPKGQLKTPPTKKPKDEEDVCFICFDGGDLVLCDRRGCPKAYHTTCIKRNESFFKARSKWNCGWHVCSSCQKKGSHYMCFTCTYSLCKACSKGADYVCVRENKGFCSLCMKMIMLIENKDQRETIQVDFDDKTSWEYLFKMYWIYMKNKASLTLDELMEAKAPQVGATGNTAVKGKDMVTVGSNKSCKLPVLDARYKCMDLDVKINQQIKISQDADSPSINTPSTDGGAPIVGSSKWASKELLAFVAHIKNGDTSELSLHDAQILLQDYVQRNTLHDPNHKSQIICDARLVKLFGKPRVGLFEMLKLLEFHFPLNDESLESISPSVGASEGNVNCDYFFMTSGDNKCKDCPSGEKGGSSADLCEYAAIDVHNINLIYLRRHLLENLVHDIDNFQDKVVGSIVRTRFLTGDKRQDMYRLVQVIGTCKIPVPYKLGEKMVDVVLEILNMDKKETISIDVVSNENFSEDECRRLRDNIKCGLAKYLTVGLIQEKAKALREVKVKDWVEMEIQRLNHLQDGASENGQENKPREYMEKLEVWLSPEVPEVHVDPTLNPFRNYAEDTGELAEKDKLLKMLENMNGREAIPSRKDGGSHDDASIKSSTADDFNKINPASVSEGLDKCSLDCENDVCGISEKPLRVDSYCSVVGGCSSPAVISSGSFSGVVSENSVAGSSPLSHVSETENIWRYRDSFGGVQGPFCLTLLRKWITTGLLPSDMKLWSIYNEELDSLLLSEVLKGQLCHKLSSQQSSVSLPSPEIQGGVSENGSTSTLTSIGGLHSFKHSPISQNFVPCLSESNSSKLVHGDEIFSRSSNLTASTFKGIDINKTSSPGWDSLKFNDNYSQQQHQVVCSDSTLMLESLKSGRDYRSWNSCANITKQTTPETSYGNPSSNLDVLGIMPPVVGGLSDKWDLNSLGSEANKSTPVSPIGYSKIDIPIKPSPTVNNNVVEASREGKSEALNLLIDQLRNQNQSQVEVPGFQNKHSSSSSALIKDSSHGWNCNSNLVVGGANFISPEIDDEWCRYSPPSLGLDFGLVSASLNLTEPPPIDQAASTSNNNQVTDLIPVLESGVSNWLEMFTEPIESVSDLLDQVDAMESQGGSLPLPEEEPAINYADYMFEDTDNDYFYPIGIPPLVSGKDIAQVSEVTMPFANFQNEASSSNSQTQENTIGGSWSLMSQPNTNANMNMVQETPSITHMLDRPHVILGRNHQFKTPITTEGGQIVCRFYTNGGCHKGSFCEFLHPSG